METPELEAFLHSRFPDRRVSHPSLWSEEDQRLGNSPVAGISWYESQAYTAWVQAHTSVAVRLPTEAEWEAAASLVMDHTHDGDLQGTTGVNSIEFHIHRTVPFGVMVEAPGSPETILGNICEWVNTAYCDVSGETRFNHPYVATDGRECRFLGDAFLRLTKGGSYRYDRSYSRRSLRLYLRPSSRTACDGFRIASSEPIPEPER